MKCYSSAMFDLILMRCYTILRVEDDQFEIIFDKLIFVTTNGLVNFPEQFHPSSVLSSKSMHTGIIVFKARVRRCESDIRHRQMSRRIDLQLCTYILYIIDGWVLQTDKKNDIYVFKNPNQIFSTWKLDRSSLFREPVCHDTINYKDTLQQNYNLTTLIFWFMSAK